MYHLPYHSYYNSSDSERHIKQLQLQHISTNIAFYMYAHIYIFIDSTLISVRIRRKKYENRLQRRYKYN